MKNTTLLTCCFLVLGWICEAQTPRSFLRYQFDTEEWDTISSLPINELSGLVTPHNVGLLSQGEMELPTDTPFTKNGSCRYSVKTVSKHLYGPAQFPHTTAVAVFQIAKGDTNILCSGSMIGTNHVLSAAHCYVSFTSDSLRFDSLVVAPQFNNGSIHPDFRWARVVSASSPLNWSSDFSDITVLEIDKPLGNLTGFLGLKSASDPMELEDQFYYKLSYPSTYFPVADSTVYNGDTLYFSYGIIDSVGPQYMQISNGTGIPGESGSTLFNSQNGWYAYGVTSLLLEFKHTRIQPWHLFAIAQILENESPSPVGDSQLVVFPNPCNNHVRIRSLASINRVEVYSLAGRLVIAKEGNGEVVEINLSHLSSGCYIVRTWTSEGVQTARVAKAM